jgi:tetratricopeptide (TPR) repeat protein
MINVKKIQSGYNQVCSLVYQRKVKDALDMLGDLIAETSYSDYFFQLEHLEKTYEQMLSYTLKGVEDPERDTIYNKLQVSILKLADKIRSLLIARSAGWHTFTMKEELEKKQKLTGKGVIESLDDLAFRIELDEIINEDKTSPSASDLRRRGLIMDIFKHLWLTDDYGEAENSLAGTMITCSDFTWPEQSLQVSAILLSALRFWDEDKIFRLIDFAEIDDPQVAGRALVALVILFYIYDRRMHLYPGILKRMELMKDSTDLDRYLEQIILQLIRTRDTMEIGKKLHEDIIPEMAKLKPDLEDKLRMKDLQDDDALENPNPDWEDMFRESDELYKKVDEFMKLQMEGADVYMTTFARLKNFPFFNEMTNWLVPFHKENPDLKEIYSMESDAFNPDLFIAGLKKMPFLCNSDKYSFIFNIRFLPDEQKQMLSTAFNMEMENLSEMVSDEQLLSTDFARRTVFIQYIQDLYRFFKLSPFKNEFEDFFEGKLELYNTLFFNHLVEDQKILRNIAEYFFEKTHYEEALDIFIMLLNEHPGNPELLEKAGYSLQKLKQYRKAIGYYHQIDVQGNPGEWVLRNTGFCYRKLGEYEKALEAYEAIRTDGKENKGVESLIAYCNLKLQRYETALQQYFKIEYRDPENHNVVRPIAWCYFALGEMEKSEKYYKKVLQLNPDFYDFINYGHLKWAMGDRKGASDNYMRSTEFEHFNFTELQKTIEEDLPVLVESGIDRNEIPLMMDYLRYAVK